MYRYVHSAPIQCGDAESSSSSLGVQLLDRVLFKFAMVSDAAAVEGAVASFLVPVLSKLASPAPTTRNKVHACACPCVVLCGCMGA